MPVLKNIPAHLRLLVGAASVSTCLVMAGCGGKHVVAVENSVSIDPLEQSNRAIYAFNDRVDKILFKPAAEIYLLHLPRPLSTAISNFFRNLADQKELFSIF